MLFSPSSPTLISLALRTISTVSPAFTFFSSGSGIKLKLSSSVSVFAAKFFPLNPNRVDSTELFAIMLINNIAATITSSTITSFFAFISFLPSTFLFIYILKKTLYISITVKCQKAHVFYGFSTLLKY